MQQMWRKALVLVQKFLPIKTMLWCMVQPASVSNVMRARTSAGISSPSALTMTTIAYRCGRDGHEISTGCRRVKLGY